MPESPEVQILAEFLDAQLTGHTLREVDLLEFRALRSRARPLSELIGHDVTAVRRLGKHLDVGFGDAHLVISLGRHGWVRWRASDTPDHVEAEGVPRALVSLTFADAGTVEVTDAGSWVSLGLSVVADPAEVAAVAKLGPDPADPGFDRAAFDAAVRRRRKQIKAVLQEQESLAGIGNAYSDEILHAVGVAPTTHAAVLDEATLTALFAATTATIRGAIVAQRGVPIDRLKAAKVAAMRVHGREGEPCPRCGTAIRSVAFGGTTAQLCPMCQSSPGGGQRSEGVQPPGRPQRIE